MYLINTPLKPFFRLFSHYVPMKVTQNLLDVVVLCTAFVLSYLLRFDFSPSKEDIRSCLIQLFIVVPIQFLALYLFGIHKFIWRYVSIRESKRILVAIFAATIPIITLRLTLPIYMMWGKVPLSITILDFCFALVGIISLRMTRREIYEHNHRNSTTKSSAKKESVLLIGAGRAGVMTLAEIKSRGDITLDVKGFIDDDSSKIGAVINGVTVLGDTSELPHIVRKLNINHVIISMAQATREDFQRILEICRSVPVRVRAIPGLFELLQEKVTVSRIRDIEIEDLLGRSPIQLEEESIQNFLNNKVIMVTGAGGSIGSELVRQLTQCKPEKLVLVERCEYALFQIEREIQNKFPEIDFVPVIADICDFTRMTRVFQRHQPQIVFHAAAHKHVPMMEFNASEALKNNSLGTNLVGELAGQNGVEAFVLISTDKAVNPTSIMGASKRVAEMFIQDLNNRFTTRYVAVRFGNVMGSNGSVIPTFREQIKKGGPVTVTHPLMERFFMTIPEATQLVLQAGAIGKGGEILILDMGKPVRILDLAKETIKLSGLTPEVDIQIVFTGMRPGEKLTEELETDKEKLSKTIHPKIFIGQIAPYPGAKIQKMMDEITDLCYLEDDDKIRSVLSYYIPEANITDNSDKFPVVIDLSEDPTTSKQVGLRTATAH